MRFWIRQLVVAGVLPLLAAPSWAQTAGGAAVTQGCRDAPSSANAPCQPKAYEQWGDGSPARAASGAPPAQPAPSSSVGGYNRFYGFGR